MLCCVCTFCMYFMYGSFVCANLQFVCVYETVCMFKSQENNFSEYLLSTFTISTTSVLSLKTAGPCFNSRLTKNFSVFVTREFLIIFISLQFLIILRFSRVIVSDGSKSLNPNRK